MTAQNLILTERAWTVATCRELTDDQWQAPTLCEGWTVEDLVAHLVSRERNPLAAVGIVVPPMHGLHDSDMRRVIARGHDDMIEKLESMPLVHRHLSANVNEFWIHNEDLARGGLHLVRPAPSGELAAALWHNLRGVARLNLRSVRHPGVIALVDTTTGEAFAYRVGGRMLPSTAHPDDAGVVLRGAPGELMLAIYGRTAAAEVRIEASDPALEAALAAARLGI